MIYLEIDGDPIAWQRPGHKSFKTQGQHKTIVYDRQKNEKEMVRWQLRAQFKEEKFTVPLLLDLTFRMPIPKSSSGTLKTQMLNGLVHHMKRPDVDNLTKFILDCMNDLIFIDDAQICTLYARKVYASVPSTLIRVRPYTLNTLQSEIDQITELEEDEYNIRGDGRGELHRNNSNKERIISTGGKITPLIPV